MGEGLVVPGLIELEPRNDENEDRLEVQWWVGGTIHVFTWETLTLHTIHQ